MKIDVLIPCHNSERFIERTLTSVIGQTRAPDRIIVHDDASTDETLKRLSVIKARFPNTQILKAETNVGILVSRQRLVSASQGDVLCFLDHDDVWPTGYLAAVAEQFSQTSVVATVGPTRTLNESGEEISTMRPGPDPLLKSHLAAGVRAIFLGYPVPTWSCLSMRRAPALRISELVGFPSGEEFALLALALEAGDVNFLRGPLIERHMGGRNASLNAERQHEAELVLLLWFLARYPSLSSELPAKVTTIFANSIYRYTLAGDGPSARRMMGALLRGIFQSKVVASLGALLLGRRLLRWLRPAT